MSSRWIGLLNDIFTVCVRAQIKHKSIDFTVLYREDEGTCKFYGNKNFRTTD